VSFVEGAESPDPELRVEIQSEDNRDELKLHSKTSTASSRIADTVRGEARRRKE